MVGAAADSERFVVASRAVMAVSSRSGPQHPAVSCLDQPTARNLTSACASGRHDMPPMSQRAPLVGCIRH